MTRKRFVKLYMAFGLPRNSANYLAKRAIDTSGSYEKFADLALPKRSDGRHTIPAIRGLSIKNADDFVRRDVSRWHISSAQ